MFFFSSFFGHKDPGAGPTPFYKVIDNIIDAFALKISRRLVFDCLNNGIWIVLKMMPKNQIIFIHGGETFDTKDAFYTYLRNYEYDPFEVRKMWRGWIEWALSADYEMIAPTMPNSKLADYEAWKIWFEKLFQFLNDQRLVIIGHSLGGLFVAKYLSENKFPKHISQLHLVSPVLSAGNFIIDPDKLKNIEPQADEIFIYHSTDDQIVPYLHSQEYNRRIPESKLITFHDRGHFLQPAFIELLENIYK